MKGLVGLHLRLLLVDVEFEILAEEFNENFVEVQTDFKIPFDVLEFNITKLLDNISN